MQRDFIFSILLVNCTGRARTTETISQNSVTMPIDTAKIITPK